MNARSTLWPSLRVWAWLTIIVLPVVSWLSFIAGEPLPMLVRSIPLGVVLSATISGFAWWLLPMALRAAAGWYPLPKWALLLTTGAFCGAAGTAAAVVVLFLLGILPAHLIRVVFLENVGGTVPVTIVITIVMILLGAATTRLKATELSLKTQELERERAEKLAAEAQLASLSSRVQPHFLFNTLNSISGLIREQPAHAEAMIEHLSSLLRSSLDGQLTERAVVEIAEELKLVTDYLEIQRTRLGGRLHYDLVVSPDASGRVPPFSLQTLAENSLKHVAGRRPDGIALRIEVRRENHRLSLEVTDDGPGFDPDAMTAGHGLDILQRRLRAAFGDVATMEFVRQPGAMTVRIRVPAT